MDNQLPDEDLVPDDSLLGYAELDALKALNDLCKRFGYGRVPQLAQHVWRLWNSKLHRCGPGPWQPDPKPEPVVPHRWVSLSQAYCKACGSGDDVCVACNAVRGSCSTCVPPGAAPLPSCPGPAHGSVIPITRSR